MKYYQDLLKQSCFIWENVCELTGNKNTASNLVQRYLNMGYIQRVRRNLYVAVDLTSGAPLANQYVIASNITPGSYVSYHSAFSYRGLNNQLFFEIYVSSPTKFSNFTFQGLAYRCMNSRLDIGVVTNPDGVSVTDLERTLIDNIDCFDRIGCIEELLECLSLVSELDEEKLRLYLDQYGKRVLYQKTGYILEHFKESMRLSQWFFDYCASKVGDSVRYLHHAVMHFNPVFCKRWRLYVPEDLLYPLGQGSEPNEFV